ncbi:hypothetical protein HHI36_022445 [Cryptolaemus montrouzieri]|uniref:Uncharacterized protein n=1 Tax=Cryptolaemus montrouzieri TaxID=559131 RepID=A0ABD2N0Z5_9CUCU
MDKILQTKDISTDKKETIIKSYNEESVIKAEKLLKDNQKVNNLQIQQEKFSNPKIEVVDIFNLSYANMDELADDINIRNYPNNVGEC